MWRQLVEYVCPDCTFADPASKSAILDAEAALGVTLPPELRELLLESNGIGETPGGVLSVEEMIETNHEMRADADQDNLYMPFDHLLIFATAPNGDLFFFPVQGDGRVNRPDIFLWEHETDSRRWIARSLEDWVERWFSGQLRV